MEFCEDSKEIRGNRKIGTCLSIKYTTKMIYQLNIFDKKKIKIKESGHVNFSNC